MAHIILIERSGESLSLLKPLASIAPVRWFEDDSDLFSQTEGAGALVLSSESYLSSQVISEIKERYKLPIYRLLGAAPSQIDGVLHFSEISLLLEAIGARAMTPTNQIAYKGARLQLVSGRLSKFDVVEFLSQKETAMLACLMGKPSEIIKRTEVKYTVWAGTKVSDASLESLVSRLRKRLDPFEIAIESVYGGGYILK